MSDLQHIPKRDQSLDIAKGICIILMVLGHSGCPVFLLDFIYSFHMPCFFFISGILLSTKYLNDIKGGILKKMKGYYFPFVKWELIFLLSHNIFTHIRIYENSYSLKEIALKTIRIFTMTGGEQLLGGYWFLISLTWASIGSIIYLSILQKRNKLTYIYILMGAILPVVIASTEQFLPFKILAQFGSQTFLALAFFMSGFLYKRLGMNKSGKLSPWVALLLIIPAIVSIFINLSMADAEASSWLYFIVAMLGIIGFLQITKRVKNKMIVEIFDYIGDKTLYILTFHFLSFKIVSYIWLICNGQTLEYLSEFPTLSNAPSWLWIIYCLVGVVVPLIIWELNHKVFALRRLQS